MCQKIKLKIQLRNVVPATYKPVICCQVSGGKKEGREEALLVEATI